MIDVAWLASDQLFLMIGLVALTMLIVHFLPKLTKAVPASLVAILVTTALVTGLSLNTKTVGDVASIAGGLPSLTYPPFLSPLKHSQSSSSLTH